MTALEASSDATTEANKPALVMGASGFLGGHITRQLCEAGRQVRVMLRDTSDTRALDGLNVQRFIGDINDTESMQAAMKDVGTIFYNVVDTRSWLTDPAPLYRTNVDGLKNVVHTAKQMGISRFVFTSSMVTLARYSGSPANEEAAFDWWHEAPAYVKSRVEAEQFVLNQYLISDVDGGDATVKRSPFTSSRLPQRVAMRGGLIVVGTIGIRNTENHSRKILDQILIQNKLLGFHASFHIGGCFVPPIE